MTWSDLTPAVLVGIAVLFLPGALVLVPWKVSALRTVALAPPVSVAILSVSGLACAVTGVRWGAAAVLVTFLAVLAISVASALGMRRVGDRAGTEEHFGGSPSSPWRPGVLGASAAGTAIAVAFFLHPFTTALQGPDLLAQRFDNAFHLNALAYVVRTGDASPFSLGKLVGAGFYPPGWYQLNGLVELLTGLPGPAVIQATTLVMIFLVWPLGVSLLVETLLHPGWVVRVVAPVLAMSFMAFPWIFMSWGLLYPNLLGFLMTPALVAAVVWLTRPTFTAWHRICPALAMVAVVAFGTLSAHPNAFLTAAAILLPYLVLRTVRLARRDLALVTRIQRAVMALAALAIPVVWVALAPTTVVAPWIAYETLPQAIGEALTGSALGAPAALVPAVLVLLGILMLLRSRERRWMGISAVLIGSVFVVSAGADNGLFRDIVSGPYYRDNYRAAAALATFLPLVAAAGAEGVVRLAAAAAQRISRRPDADGPAGVPRAHVMFTLVVGIVASSLLSWSVTSSKGFDFAMEQVRIAFKFDETSSILTPDERELMERIPSEVPVDETVVVDPWDGGGLVYAFGSRNVSEFYMFSSGEDEDVDVIRHSLRDVADDPAVCRALDADHARYFIQMDPNAIADFDSDSTYPGYVGIDPETPGFEVVDQQGQVTLYRITACD